VTFNALDTKARELKLRRDPACPICGDRPTIKELIDYDPFCGIQRKPLNHGWTRISRLARRFVVERHCGCRSALAFLFGHQTAQVFRITNDRAGVRMFCRPLARVFTKAVDVVAGFARQFVFHPPDFF